MSKLNKKLKIRICSFDIAKYGGIVNSVENWTKSLKDMGHDVDIIHLTYNKTLSQSTFDKKILEFEKGTFQEKQNNKSQYGGYEKSEVTGYWQNSYYGWFLPPFTNRIPIFAENAEELWNEAMEDVDLVFWNFIPTKTKEAKGFNDWYKFFDLPKSTKQVLAVHDGYFDIRTSWLKYLKGKIKYLDCVHLAAYNCCDNFSFRRQLSFAPRKIEEKPKFKPQSKRKVDFFAAHVFKSMKKMEDILSCMPYLEKGVNVQTAGSGIELYFMMQTDETKFKDKYTISKKTDPDCLDENIGKSMWSHAESLGMNHNGFLSLSEIYDFMKKSKFAIDPSFSKHYAKYSDTHLNSFTVEAIINGCYPVLRDTTGLIKKETEDEDIIRKRIRAIYIPWDATPKEFARYLNEALKMSPKKYIKDLKHNFKVAKELFNPDINMENLLNAAFDKDTFKGLKKGKNSIKVKQDSKKIMEEFFEVELPIKWKNK